MNTTEVLDMIQILKETGYKHIDVAHEGSHIILSNSEYISQGLGAMTTQVSSQTQEFSNQANTTPATNVVENTSIDVATDVEVAQVGHMIESPIVGTYYNAPSPDADPYVKVGDAVKKGDILCIIEAMKLMNEIEADQDGQIAEILVENEQGVEYGQPLFRIV